MYTKFSTYLTKYREQRGYTPGQMADKLNISVKMYLTYETGEYTPEYDRLEQIADVLEFKYTKNENDNLEKLAEKAIEQSKEKQYAAEMKIHTIVYVCFEILPVDTFTAYHPDISQHPQISDAPSAIPGQTDDSQNHGSIFGYFGSALQWHGSDPAVFAESAGDVRLRQRYGPVCQHCENRKIPE